MDILISSFIGLGTALVVTFIGFMLSERQRKSQKRDEQVEAVAAIRFELQLNLGWLSNIFDTRNYLRDEAWNTLKDKGYISYLPAPIPMKTISVYNKLHHLNGQIHILREQPDKFSSDNAETAKATLAAEATELISLLDAKFPNIGKNFS
jgi:hypothetical protein